MQCKKPIFQKVECPPGKSTKILKSEEQTYVFKTVEQSVLDKKTDHPLFRLEGVTPLHVRGDSLHILYSRGVANHLAGSLFHYVISLLGQCICQNDKPQGVNAMWHNQAFQSFSLLGGKSSRDQAFSSLLGSSPERTSWPCRGSCPYHNDWSHPCLQSSCHALWQYGCLSDTIGICHWTELCEKVLWCLPGSEQLGFDKRQKAVSYHPQVSLCFLHLFQNTKFLNFRVHHNFRSEDYVGKVSQLAHSCSFGAKPTRVPAKLVDKYRIPLHLQLTKPGFGYSEEATETWQTFLSGSRVFEFWMGWSLTKGPIAAWSLTKGHCALGYGLWQKDHYGMVFDQRVISCT